MKIRIAIGVIVFLMLILLWSCTAYNPYFGSAGYDVLNPPPIIKKNPLRVTEDGNLVVSPEFLDYVKELQLEVKRLRKEIK